MENHTIQRLTTARRELKEIEPADIEEYRHVINALEHLDTAILDTL